VPQLELHGLEKLREAELEEAPSIRAVMLPVESLRTKLVTSSQEFQSLSALAAIF
jgi:hypothetical protein